MEASSASHELDRIESALRTKALNPEAFERCVQDLLTAVYPGLSPIPGGSDSGRDADVRVDDGGEPLRVMITSSRTVGGVRKNMVTGIRSLRTHNVAADRIVLANAAVLNERARQGLITTARKEGVSIYDIFDATYLASRLRQDSMWRQKLLGLPGYPISVSRVPADVAESPWGRLPLRGREADLDRVRTISSDFVLSGLPGSGKTRLLVELDDVLFVERGAKLERLADDLRTLQPSRVVVDDAAAALDLLQFVRQLRRTESDLLKFAIIATCWPHDAEEVAEALPNAGRVHLTDLEREHVDALIVEMGVTGIAARQTVVEQAEGRAGWAVALAALLLRAEWTDVLSGRALLHQVAPFLRRMRLGDDARRIASVVAAVGGVRDDEVALLASTVDQTEAQTRTWLQRIARGGLLEVIPEFGGTSPGSWVVRPVMFGSALVTDVLFAEDVSLISIDRILKDWPHRRGEVNRSVCISAAAGANGARRRADLLVVETLASPSDVRLRSDFLGLYTEMDSLAAQTVLAAIASDRQQESSKRTFLTVEIVQICRIAMEAHGDRAAVSLLLDLAAEADAVNVHDPMRPARVLTDLSQQTLPNQPIDATLRYLIADVLSDWLPPVPTERQWQVWGVIAAAVVNPHVKGAYLNPGDHSQIGLLDGLLGAADLERLRATVWPRLNARIQDAPDDCVRAILPAVEEWVRVGRGYDHPYGQNHPEPQITACLGEGTALLNSLSSSLISRVGWPRRLAHVYQQFGLALAAGLPTDDDPFFRDLSLSPDPDAAERAIRDDLAEAVRGWGEQPAHDVVARLVGIRAEATAAGSIWPNRVEMACQSIAATFDGSAREWVEEALHQGLFPEAASFVDAWKRSERITADNELVLAMLAVPSARPVALLALLTGDDAEVAVELVADSDGGVVTVLALRGGMPPEAEQRMLELPPSRIRASYALHMVARRPNPFEGSDGANVDIWARAVGVVQLERLESHEIYRFGQAVEFLQTTAPDRLRTLLPSLIGRTPIIDLGRLLMQGLAPVLARLPRDLRTEIVRSRPADLDRATVVGVVMSGDYEWIEFLVDNNELDAAGAVAAASRTRPVDVASWARTLVPRGVLPQEVASLAAHGAFSGSRAAHLGALVDEMKHLASDPDQSVAVVGRAGVAMFEDERAEAIETERRERIRR